MTHKASLHSGLRIPERHELLPKVHAHGQLARGGKSSQRDRELQDSKEYEITAHPQIFTFSP
jgi:hypothetical protein